MSTQILPDRRTILKSFGAILAAVGFGSKSRALGIVIDKPLPPGWIKLPPWCPTGWIPQLGQRICEDQFPELFQRLYSLRNPTGSASHVGRRHGLFVPPFHPWVIGSAEPVLMSAWPRELTDLERNGIFNHDPINRYPVRTEEKVLVHLLAATRMRGANGRVCMPGMSLTIEVPRKDFEAFYGSEPRDNTFPRDYTKFGGYSGYSSYTGLYPTKTVEQLAAETREQLLEIQVQAARTVS